MKHVLKQWELVPRTALCQFQHHGAAKNMPKLCADIGNKVFLSVSYFLNYNQLYAFHNLIK